MRFHGFVGPLLAVAVPLLVFEYMKSWSISLAEMFALHGLSTPGFVMHATELPAVAAQLSVLFRFDLAVAVFFIVR